MENSGGSNERPVATPPIMPESLTRPGAVVKSRDVAGSATEIPTAKGRLSTGVYRECYLLMI